MRFRTRPGELADTRKGNPRYRDRASYLQQVETAARRLVDERYVLASDVAAIVDRAGRHWDLLMPTATSSR